MQRAAESNYRQLWKKHVNQRKVFFQIPATDAVMDTLPGLGLRSICHRGDQYRIDCMSHPLFAC